MFIFKLYNQFIYWVFHSCLHWRRWLSMPFYDINIILVGGHNFSRGGHVPPRPSLGTATDFLLFVPDQYLYSTPEQLCKRLQELCRRPDLARRHVVMVTLSFFFLFESCVLYFRGKAGYRQIVLILQVDTSLYSWTSLKPQFQALLSAEGTWTPHDAGYSESERFCSDLSWIRVNFQTQAGI